MSGNAKAARRRARLERRHKRERRDHLRPVASLGIISHEDDCPVCQAQASGAPGPELLELMTRNVVAVRHGDPGEAILSGVS